MEAHAQYTIVKPHNHSYMCIFTFIRSRAMFLLRRARAFFVSLLSYCWACRVYLCSAALDIPNEWTNKRTKTIILIIIINLQYRKKHRQSKHVCVWLLVLCCLCWAYVFKCFFPATNNATLFVRAFFSINEFFLLFLLLLQVFLLYFSNQAARKKAIFSEWLALSSHESSGLLA